MQLMEPRIYSIYTDGACSTNGTWNGGAGVFIKMHEVGNPEPNEKGFYMAALQTTNNVMEMEAFLFALKHAQETVDVYDVIGNKIIDVIQELKEKQKEFPKKACSLTEILKRFDKEMDSHEKDLINEILKEQKWTK